MACPGSEGRFTGPPPTSSPVEVDAATFAKFLASVLETRRGLWLTPYTVEDFEGMRCFLSHGGRAGGALKPAFDGIELVSLFNRGAPRGSGAKMAAHLVEQGADHLSCTGPELRRFYEDIGFEEVESLGWDDRLAPPGWDYERDNRPMVYVMEFRR